MIFKKNNTRELFKSNGLEFCFLEFSKLKNKFNMIKNWHLNRPVDCVRVDELKEYLLTTQEAVLPGCIAGWVNQSGELEIYDGFHRISALLDINREFYIYIKIVTRDINYVLRDFKNINKSISVPFVYLEENNKIKKGVCERVAQRMCERYKHNISSSRKPQKQNFNRDNLVDFISMLDIDFLVPNLDTKIFTELLGINQQAKKYIEEYGLNVPYKCYKYGLWLFYLPSDTIKAKIEERLQIF